MARTLAEILTHVNSIIDLEATTPTDSELTLRIDYVNQAIDEAASTGQFAEFDKVYEAGLTSAATVPLPSNFREFKVNPQLLDSSGNWNEYEEIAPHEKYEKGSGDRYCYVLGNPQEGYNLVLNSMIENATLSVIYQRYPSGVATLTDVVELADPIYIARKVESYVLYSRSDDRFPQANAIADRHLLNMYGRESKSPGGQSRNTRMKFKNPLR